jgi:hypothetical protein
MAAPFNPPSADLPGKPAVEAWTPPPTSKLDIDWAKLRTIELSLLDSPDPKVVQELVDTCKVAIRDDGFIFLTNYGVSLDQVSQCISIVFKSQVLIIISFTGSLTSPNTFTATSPTRIRRGSTGTPMRAALLPAGSPNLDGV